MTKQDYRAGVIILLALILIALAVFCFMTITLLSHIFEVLANIDFDIIKK